MEDYLLLSNDIKYIGVTNNGIVKFKVSTNYGQGDGQSQDWVIGLLFKPNEWADDFKGKKLRYPPICVIEVNDHEALNYRNSNFSN